MYNRKIIEELNDLSKITMGSSGKWRKMIEKGVPELIMEDTKKMIMKNGKEEYEIIKTPKLYATDSGAELHQYTLRRYTVESIRDFMLTIKDRREQLQVAIKRIEEQQKAEAAAKALAEKASGTAV